MGALFVKISKGDIVESVQSDSVVQNTRATGIGHIREYFADYRTWLPELAMYGGIGFLVGFLLKNFGRAIIGTVVVVLATLIVLQYAGLMTTSVTGVLGLPGISSFQEGLDFAVNWVKLHIPGVIGLIVGTALGWKIG
jgi:uncharacterized membrane protein (Fun14 family)